MKKAYEIFRSELDSIKEAGTYKDERIITTPQKARIDTTVAKGVLNMCANNYLGLSNNPEVIAAAKASYDEWGFGLSSVRFICGTQQIHKQLERKIADFLGMDDCILYTSCFDANGGLFFAGFLSRFRHGCRSFLPVGMEKGSRFSRLPLQYEDKIIQFAAGSCSDTSSPEVWLLGSGSYPSGFPSRSVL